jgi:Uncharacterized conserved protein (DUF2190)
MTTPGPASVYRLDYTPIHVPGVAITLQAAGPIEPGDPVQVAGSGTIERADAGTDSYVGIAGHSAPIGGLVAVFCGKLVHEGPAENDITAGNPVATSGTEGYQVTEAADPLDPSVIGLALTSAADAEDCRWLQY